MVLSFHMEEACSSVVHLQEAVSLSCPHTHMVYRLNAFCDYNCFQRLHSSVMLLQLGVRQVQWIRAGLLQG